MRGLPYKFRINRIDGGKNEEINRKQKMKTRRLWLIAVAVAGFWFGRLAWRAHHNLVTLNARNMPLAEVVRSLERQTWEKIKYDRSLNAKITLNVKDAPLDSVLDLVADRAGARWQKTYAIGPNRGAISKLESVLEAGGKLDSTGWTNVAPPPPDLPREVVIGGGPIQTVPPPDGSGPGSGPMAPGGGRMMRRLFRPGGPPGGEDPGGVGPSGHGGGGIVAPSGGQAIMIMPDGSEDIWNSERIVLATDLLPQLGSNAPSEASAESAQQIANAVHGRSQLYYSIAAAPFGMGGHVFSHRMSGGGRKAGGGPDQGPDGGDIVSMMTKGQQQRRLSEMGRSPEEQVERARENATNKMRFQAVEEDSKAN